VKQRRLRRRVHKGLGAGSRMTSLTTLSFVLRGTAVCTGCDGVVHLDRGAHAYVTRT
jgi:hypothetical protein